jgi:AraC-like DNA-binding protein
MKIIRERTHIPQGNIERFIPSSMLTDIFFTKIGIRNGGLNILHRGCLIERPENRAYHIINITIAGEGMYMMEDGSSSLSKPGYIFFSHAGGQGHKHWPYITPWRTIWLQVNSSCNWLIPPFSDWGLIKTNSPENAIRLYAILEAIINEDLYRYDEWNRVQYLSAEMFMIYLQRELQIHRNYRLGRYQTKLNQLWQNIAVSLDERWDMKKMCDFAGMSRAHLSRLCTALYQKSPGAKVREIKMEHAYTLFHHFDYQVSEVAELVGYENASNFSIAYKKYFGHSPRKAK